MTRDQQCTQAGPAAEDEANLYLRQIPVLLAAVEDLREIVRGRAKSHLTIEEVAESTGRAPYTIRTWVKSGLIAAVRVSGTGPRGRLLVPRAELEKLVASGRGGKVRGPVVD